MGKRILVADDSRTIQQAFAMVMDGAGYTLSFAKSVDEALSVAKRDGRPDLVLSDAALGTGSGYDLCAQLKADDSFRDVQVYILASLQTPYDETRGRKVGADGHLAKPFESQALLDAVASALATPARRASASMPSQLADSGANTSRYAEEDVIEEDEDSYGEIVIERGPSPAASTQSTWASKPATKPPMSHPAPSPMPSPPAAARAPMIPTPRPPTASGPVRTGSTPAPTPATAGASQPRHTVMGFPTVRPGTSGRGPAGVPPIASPMAPAPSRPTTMSPPTAPLRPPILGMPAPASAPTTARPATSVPPAPAPWHGMPPRPAMPKIAPAPPAPAPRPSPIPEPILQAPPTSRHLASPVPDDEVEPPAPIAAAVSSAVEKVDRKIASLAAQGPEYAAIAKLSREIIEQVVWEVVPELAETIIRQEIDRLASAKK